MKRNVLALLLALSILCAALSACSGSESQTQETPVCLWYFEDTVITQTLEALAGEYNDSRADGEPPVSLRAFESEQELALALEMKRPELLLCYHSKAVDLHERGLLVDISSPLSDCVPKYAQSLTDSSGCVGTSFFPLGCAVYTLACREQLIDSYDLTTLESLCISSAKYYEDTGLPFFAVANFTDLFFICMDGLGQSFRADRRSDIQNESYKYIYNLLSDAAYNGGMDARAGDPAAQLRGGGLACGVISSMQARLLPDGFTLTAVPRVSGSGQVCDARVLGLAVTAEADEGQQAACCFLRWMLGAKQSSAMCDRAGLMSVTVGAGEGFGAKLAQIYEGYSLYMVSESLPYYDNRAAFDAAFRSAMEYVA